MAFSTLRTLFRKYPLISNMVVCSSLYAGGDVCQQVIRRVDEYDLKGTRSIAIVTFSAQGPLYYYWYKLLDRMLPGTAIRSVIPKVFIDQFLIAPPSLFVFFTGTSILDGKEDIYKDFKEKAMPAFVSGCVFWGVAQSVNFLLVPGHMRTVYVSAMAFVWSNILCFIKSNE
ncbi:mpv17-like protein [Tubulanus polymorphus]|uniref:mpv17-like protein n=1 Tax=Tubulanus polymorphus TaxID=672921 RepID=UPI003DA6A0B0